MNPQSQSHSQTATAKEAAVELVLDVGPVAHGGHCVARHEGRVIFVRHGIPGEKVRVRLTDAGESAKFWRADVVEVLDASPDRVEHFWRAADSLPFLAARAPAGGRGRIRPHRPGPPARTQVGGTGRTASAARRRRPFARRPWPGQGTVNLVEAVAASGPGAESGSGTDATYDAGTGLGWRTRASFSVTPGGKLGMHAHRSDHIIPVREMPLASEGINGLRLWDIDLQGIERVEVAAPANGSRPLVLLAPAPGTKPKRLSAIAAQLPDDVSVATFDPLSGDVAAAARPHLGPGVGSRPRLPGHRRRLLADPPRRARERLWGPSQNSSTTAGSWRPGSVVADLYAGAGLFTAPLADAVGETGSVLSVEGAPGTSRDARKNLHEAPQVEIVQGRVERILRQKPRNFDAMVLDPPRAGAGKAVVSQLVAAGPRAVAYVSCDPASFARDVGYFQQAGLVPGGLARL